MTQAENNIHPLHDAASNKETPTDSPDLSFEAVQQLLVETRASLDILTEMVCLIYADGDEDKFQKTLEALEYRQKEAESRILNASEHTEPEASP